MLYIVLSVLSIHAMREDGTAIGKGRGETGASKRQGLLFTY